MGIVVLNICCSKAAPTPRRTHKKLHSKCFCCRFTSFKNELNIVSRNQWYLIWCVELSEPNRFNRYNTDISCILKRHIRLSLSVDWCHLESPSWPAGMAFESVQCSNDSVDLKKRSRINLVWQLGPLSYRILKGCVCFGEGVTEEPWGRLGNLRKD